MNFVESDLASVKDTIILGGVNYNFFSLPNLENIGVNLSRLPYSIRIMLEAALRNFDGKKILEHHIMALIDWGSDDVSKYDIPFVASRVVLQDFTGIPLLADLAAMRECARQCGLDSALIEPLVPVDLVIDHSVQTSFTGSSGALHLNMEEEFLRNAERYEFIKWGGNAFNAVKVIPPGIGIVHQVNLEYLAQGLIIKDKICYPDTVIGTDSHTTMINGLSIVGWGVGGIEAEASMLGQPIYMLQPEVIGVHLSGKINSGVTTTDIVLTITEMLRKENVVGKFIEYFGNGASELSVPERATIANMAPDYGATMGLFLMDNKTLEYYIQTGRSEALVQNIETYYRTQNLFDIDYSLIDYTKVIELDLSKITPSVSGPKRPQERIPLSYLKSSFNKLLTESVTSGGYGKSSIQTSEDAIKDGDILIAGITSCTNTSNPSVLIAAGLLAKKAVEKGLTVNEKIKTSIAPGSRAVTLYLEKAGLQKYLDKLGFYTAGYGCATCIGNVGEIHKASEASVIANNTIACAVLSGNRNFEARIHPSLRANFLMSPPLVVAFAIAGTVNINMDEEPLGLANNGEKVYLNNIWPSHEEIAQYLPLAQDPEIYKLIYGSDLNNSSIYWAQINESNSFAYDWKEKSTYIAKPPFFENFSLLPLENLDVLAARALVILGDFITTDHISPAGSISSDSPAGKYLKENNVQPQDFNSFGTRRGHHEVMIRGTFSNVRLKNLMLENKEGGFTKNHLLGGEIVSIYDAAMGYKKNSVPTIVFAGQEYGTGSARDWAAKGTQLLGVKVVVAQSFERIHRSNLIGMGVLPCQFPVGVNAQVLNLTGAEKFDIINVHQAITKKDNLILLIYRDDTTVDKVKLICRLDTEIEVEYFKNGGILPYMLRTILNTQSLLSC